MNKMFHTRLGAAAIMLALGVNAPVNAESAALPAPAPVPAPTTTVWNRLGIPQAFHKMRDSTTNRRGNRPESERTDPLKRIADPANLDSPNPAIKKAAEVKADQDLAPQKIKAIKYLATVGCDCYPGVKDALWPPWTTVRKRFGMRPRWRSAKRPAILAAIARKVAATRRSWKSCTTWRMGRTRAAATRKLPPACVLQPKWR